MNTIDQQIQAIKDRVAGADLGITVNAVNDPDDPRSICVMHFHTEVIRAFYDAERITVFRDLPLNEQISCMVTGMLTGMMTIGIVSAGKDKADKVEEFIREAIAPSRFNAERLLAQFKADTGCHV